MGSTTENPSFQVIPALLSRAQVIILNPVDDERIKKIINKGYDYLFKNYPAQNVKVKDEALETIVKLARGDARFALNTVENSYFAANGEVTKELIENLLQKRTAKYGIDEHYDLASAYQKSLRGSDADAAIYFLAKMLVSGEDPRFIARRLLVVASEDVGNADFRALLVAEAALRATEHLGMPEGRIALAQATEFVARAKKSNRAICAVDAAISDIKNGLDFKPPLHLRDSHYKDASKYGFGEGYIYTHNAPDVYQRFMPDELGDKKYFT